MLRKFLNRLTPDRQMLRHKLGNKWYVRPFRELLRDPGLWHINRRGTSGAFALALFICCLPIPGHTLLAVMGALFWRLNLPTAVVSVWVNNPITGGPIYYFSYLLGARILQQQTHPLPTTLSVHWLISEFSRIWEPLWLGCIVSGVLLAGVGYIVLSITWQVSIRLRWQRRQHQRNLEKASNK